MNKAWDKLIDRYLLQELSDEERKEFRELLHHEPDFREQLKLSQAIAAGFERLHEEEIASRILNRNTPTRAKRRKKFMIGLYIAAAIAVLIYIGLGPKYSPEEVYRMAYSTPEYFKEYSRTGNNGLTIPQKIRVREAVEMYNKRDFQLAAMALESVIEQVDMMHIPEEILFYYGICCIENKETEKALNTMQYLSKERVLLQREAQWYLALFYLKKGEKDKAKTELQELVNEDLYRDRANHLLTILKEKRWF